MSAYAIPAPAVTTTDRLSVTLFFAVCAHLIVVLGITFVKEDRPRSVANTLDVVLVQRKSDTVPEEADFLGQASQEGGGESEEVARPATPLPSHLLANEPEVAAASPPVVPSTPVEAPPEPQPEADVAPPRAQPTPKPVLALEKSPAEDKVAVQSREVKTDTPPVPEASTTRVPPGEKVARAAPTHRPRPEREPEPEPAPRAEAAPVQTIDAAALVRRSLAMASLSAEVDQRLDAYAKRPRRKWISARTREHKYAAYMEAWRSKVERVGNLNYPDEARRRRLSGDLLLDVSLKPDGSVDEIVVRRTSGHRVLDDAAIRIVRLAAPFARFPKAIREETDLLHIQRTWRFLTSNRFASR
jgi:protein TonB